MDALRCNRYIQIRHDEIGHRQVTAVDVSRSAPSFKFATRMAGKAWQSFGDLTKQPEATGLLMSSC